VTFRPYLAAALAVVFLGAAARPEPLLVYSAPAGDRPAGADAVLPTDSVLPDGRLGAPAGKSVFVGTNPLGFALSPDGRFAIVSNDDQRTGGLSIPNSEPPLAIGYSLTVVDTQTMNVVDVFRDPSVTFFMGVAAVRDPNDPSATLVFASDGALGAVRVFDLDALGHLALEPQPIALPRDGSAHAFPASIAASPDGRTLYVVDNVGDTVSAIDVASRRIVQTMPVGYAPLYAAAGGGRVIVSNGGLAAYTAQTPAAQLPAFGAPAFDPERSSSLTISAVEPGGGFAADPDTVRMDPAPDGTTDIGGADPGAIVLAPDEKTAYVALSNVDRIAVVSLAGEPEVVRGLDLRLFPEAPYAERGSAGRSRQAALRRACRPQRRRRPGRARAEEIPLRTHSDRMVSGRFENRTQRALSLRPQRQGRRRFRHAAADRSQASGSREVDARRAAL